MKKSSTSSRTSALYCIIEMIFTFFHIDVILQQSDKNMSIKNYQTKVIRSMAVHKYGNQQQCQTIS